MYIRYRDQLPQLMKAMNLPLTAAVVGVYDGLYANRLMSQGMQLLMLVDEWTASTTMDDSNMHEYYDNQLLQVQNRMTVYDNRTEQYVILQGSSQDIAPHVHDSSLSLVYIDQQDSIVTDIEQWYPKLAIGGILAMSNYNTIQEQVTIWAADNQYNISDIVSIPEYTTNAGVYIIKH